LGLGVSGCTTFQASREARTVVAGKGGACSLPEVGGGVGGSAVPRAPGAGSTFRGSNIGFRVPGLGVGVWGSGFRVPSLGFRVLGLGFGVEG